MNYSSDELQTIPLNCGVVSVELKQGPPVVGVWDGAFVIDTTGEITGCQVLDRPPWGVRFIARYDINRVIVS